jgi:subtilisin family serine protease
MQKVSPVFEVLLSDEDPDIRREAIVVFQAPATTQHLRGRLRILRQRLQAIKRLARTQAEARSSLVSGYGEIASAHLGGEEPVEPTPIGGSVLPTAKIEVTGAMLPELAERSDVIAIMPNQSIHLISPLRVDYRRPSAQEEKDKLTWGLKTLEIPKLWPKSKGAEIKVGVIDTGVYAAHFALKDRVKGFVVIDPAGNRINASPEFDAAQHGTHVCGTIAGGTTEEGLAIGVAPNAQLLVAAVMLGNATLAGVIEAISWAVENGADIINMSLGFSYYEPLFANILEQLLMTLDVLPVVSIGNSSHGSTSCPGNVAHALSVGAVEGGDPSNLSVAFFSGGASFVFPGAQHNQMVTKPDVVAPGAQIFSAIPPQTGQDGRHLYACMNGTSMAAPHVAGVAALLMSAHPNAPANSICEVLKETASHPEGLELRPDNRWGHGVVNPEAALAALSS